MKGAIEDPVLDRALSPTGLTTSEEMQAQTVEAVLAYTHLWLKANYEEPKSGWPDVPPLLPRPRGNELRQPPEVEKEPVPMGTAADVISFTEAGRE